MALSKSKMAAAAAMLAAASTGIAPASAADFQLPQANIAAPMSSPLGINYADGWSTADEVYEHRRYRRHRHHRRGVRAGDVILGAIILGGIAAASSSKKRQRDERYRDRDYRDRDYRDRDYRDTRQSPRNYDTGGLDRAAQMCVREIERDVRVESVDNVTRTSAGWNVTGSLYNGDGFSCSIDNDGRVSGVDIRGGGNYQSSAAAPQDNQWSDDRYARARMQSGNAPVREARAASTDGPQPAYPGGPLPGEDDRYTMAEDDG